MKEIGLIYVLLLIFIVLQITPLYQINTSGKEIDYKVLLNDETILLESSQQPPEPFIFSSNADNPDTDGIFNLTWTPLFLANNYSIYVLNTAINERWFTLLADHNATSPYDIIMLANGNYIFGVVVFNGWE